MKYDVIIIGAGLGGLTAGAKLAKEGKKILLIEQHSQPGGCATTFQRGEFTFEVGLHEMDGPSPNDMKSRIFNELAVSENVQFIKIPEFYHFHSDHLKITISHNSALAISVLKDKFPDEIDGIDAFFNQILNSGKNHSEKESSEEISLGKFLDSIIWNNDLKLVLLGNLGYFHDDPYTLSLKYYSVAQGSYFNSGASFIRGGSQKLSDHLALFIEKHGGKVLLNHSVTRLVTENDKLTGVEYKKKRGSLNELVQEHADEIIVNAALPNIVKMMPDEYGMKLTKEIGDQLPGASLLTIYFGFKKSLKTIGHNHYSTFVFDGSIKTQADIINNNRGDFASRSYTFIDYGQIDSALAPEGKSVGAICCIDYLNDWDTTDEKVYKLKKEEVGRIFISRLEKLIPGVSELIEFFEVGTPATIKRYTLNTDGAVYGFAQIPGKKNTDTLNVFRNLYTASAWGKTGGGFSGSIYSGILSAYSILRKRK